LTWLRTVSTLRWSSAAISFVVRPRSSSFEHLRLPRREVKIGVLVRLLDQVRDLAEDAHDVVAMVDRHRADLGGDPSAVRRQQDHGGVRDLGAADDLAREQLPRAPRRLGRDDGGELAPPDVADDVLCRAVQPADHSRRVDVVARHVDVVEYLVDLHRLQRRSGHGGSLASSTGRFLRRAADAGFCRRRLSSAGR
jgi:hypothetical protein